MTDELAKSLENLKRTMESVAERASAEIIQLPLWSEPKRGTPNSFLRSALFSAIQSKDREFLERVTLASQDGIANQIHWSAVEPGRFNSMGNLVHLAKRAPAWQYLHIYGARHFESVGPNHRRHCSKSGFIKELSALLPVVFEITHEGKTYSGPLIEGSNKDESNQPLHDRA